MAVIVDGGAGGRPGEKSPRAYRTIAEVALELDLAPHVLRFWESKFSQLKPLKRRGGRRYYRPEDVVLLRRIRGLLYGEGYTIRGAQKLLRETAGRAAAARDADALPQPPPALPQPLVPEPTIAGAELRRSLEEILAALERVRALLDPPAA